MPDFVEGLPALLRASMTSRTAIRAWAKGWLPTEAAAELLISHRSWLEREDFLQVAVEVGWEPFRGPEVAAVDFAAAAARGAGGAAVLGRGAAGAAGRGQHRRGHPG